MLDMHYDHLRHWRPDGTEAMCIDGGGDPVPVAAAWYDFPRFNGKGEWVPGEHVPPSEFVRALRSRLGSDRLTVVWHRLHQRWMIGQATKLRLGWSDEGMVAGVRASFRPEVPHTKFLCFCEDPDPRAPRGPNGMPPPWPLDRRIIDHLEELLGSSAEAQHGKFMLQAYRERKAAWDEKVRLAAAAADKVRHNARKNWQSLPSESMTKEERAADQKATERAEEHDYREHMGVATMLDATPRKAA